MGRLLMGEVPLYPLPGSRFPDPRFRIQDPGEAGDGRAGAKVSVILILYPET